MPRFSKETPWWRRLTPFHWALVGIAAVLIGLYLGGIAFFSTRFMPHTTLDGTDVSLVSLAELESQVEEKVTSWSATVTGEGLDLTLDAQQIGLTFDAAAYTREALAQVAPWTWPVGVLLPHDIRVASVGTVDTAALTAVLEPAVAAINETAAAPVNATISYDGNAQTFVVIEEVPGGQLDLEAVVARVGAKAEELQQEITVGTNCLVQPTVTASMEEVTQAATAANQLVRANVTLTLGGQDAYVVTKEMAKNWVTLGENLTPTLDSEAVVAWAKSDLSSELDTVGSERTYTRADGKVITVKGGTYGWNINSSELAGELATALASGSDTTLAIPTYSEGAQLPSATGRDWTGRYIDMDLSEQHVRMYNDAGELIWEADCVTGDSSKGYDTPTGVYYINSNFNKSNPGSTLKGQIDPVTKQPEYETPVAYWMPFVNNLIGFHDASWRSSFGGSIYTYDGSHGCVNLPVSKAGELCSLIQVGDVVVVHN